ncbi:MAG: hypothetical protein H6569_02545 [Lewinellaceae bacterium]|nr:hypothetical protein [Lewinellaceae bacterium]
MYGTNLATPACSRNCQEIVANANSSGKRHSAPITTLPQNAALRRDNGVIDVFWGNSANNAT